MEKDELNLPEVSLSDRPELINFKSQLKQIFKYTNFSNETTRREFLIAPVLFQLMNLSEVRFEVSVEKAILYNELLKGTLDYYLSSQSSVVVIEAKNADLVNGLKPLAAELIALDHLEEEKQTILYGAVSIGHDWQFLQLNRKNKKLIEDIRIYSVPQEVEHLLGVLLKLLE